MHNAMLRRNSLILLSPPRLSPVKEDSTCVIHLEEVPKCGAAYITPIFGTIYCLIFSLVLDPHTL